MNASEIPEFMSNANAAYEEAVDGEDDWEEFINSWWYKFADRGVRTNELLDLAWNNDLLTELPR